MNHSLRISLVAAVLAGVGAFITPRRILRKGWNRVTAVGRWLNADAPRNRVTVFVLVWIVALVPMLHLTYLVRHYAVEVPTLDDWEMANLIVSAKTGHLTWADIFAQQQEARTVLPKLIFLVSAAGGHWDVRPLMMLSVICCWFTAAGIFILLRRSGLGPAAIAVTFFLAALTIFTPAKYELWIFASGFPSFVPALFLVTALIVVGTDGFSLATKFVLCGVLAIASSFTLAHGLLAWGLTFPALFLMRKVPHWKQWLAGWIGLTALCAIAYFWGYQKPPTLPTFAPAVSWMDYARFILEFLGGSLAYSWRDRAATAATIFGAGQLVLFLAAILYLLRQFRDRALIARAVPWVALACYSIGSACLAALGRVGYGTPYALASRYVTFSIYLTIGVTALVALIIHENYERRPRFLARPWWVAMSFILVLAYLIPYKAAASNTRFFLRALSANDRLGRAAVLFCQAFDTTGVIMKTIYPKDARPVTDAAGDLDRLKLIRPPLIRTNQIDALPHEPADGKRVSGACEAVVPTDGNKLRATGWAVLNAKGRPPDCVAIAYQTGLDQGWAVAAISDSFVLRADIVKRFGTMDQIWSGWSATLPANLIPPGAKLSFWAVDADEPRLYRIVDPP
jgi:hypothetical protein